MLSCSMFNTGHVRYGLGWRSHCALSGLELMALPILRIGSPAHQRSAQPRIGHQIFFDGQFRFGFVAFWHVPAVWAYQTHRAGVDSRGPVCCANGQTLPALVVALALMLAGMEFKAAAAPFHVWVSDVYEGAPTTVTAFMSVAAKTASFAMLARVLVMALPQLGAQWSGALALMAVDAAGGQYRRRYANKSQAHAGVLGHSPCGLRPAGDRRLHCRRALCDRSVFDLLPVMNMGPLPSGAALPCTGKSWAKPPGRRQVRPGRRRGTCRAASGPGCGHAGFSFFADGHPADGGLYGQIHVL